MKAPKQKDDRDFIQKTLDNTVFIGRGTYVLKSTYAKTLSDKNIYEVAYMEEVKRCGDLICEKTDIDIALRKCAEERDVLKKSFAELAEENKNYRSQYLGFTERNQQLEKENRDLKESIEILKTSENDNLNYMAGLNREYSILETRIRNKYTAIIAGSLSFIGLLILLIAYLLNK